MRLDVPLVHISRVPEAAFQAILERAKVLTLAEWTEDESRQKSFKCHQDTRAIPLIYGRNLNQMTYCDAWENDWKDYLLPVLTPILQDFYGDGEIVRMCLADLLPYAKVLEHKDDTEEVLLHTHRIHLPIISNPDVDFFIEEENFNLKVGNLYEFSNQQFHRVENRSGLNRIHLIFDYMTREVLDLFRDKHRENAPVAWQTSYRDTASGQTYLGEA
ncbi:aspartyl/asparaginyl beta-hydroxylase domain-containing protein [Massilia sp. erpn]|uniref:aspartyl/asparaginyl beta-hydroxylase domain-containing protein n=1 Tax=Massilia sp. erpn TaxID=2738142 RepID=UPI0021057FD1|nr:aspartyl/asparaginyl beta-hydroxylase domain-containing protein [Massilia sp. erpn]UTY57068.1 hypothetical protein HPQ68_07600 [Massilia sp. erpn]